MFIYSMRASTLKFFGVLALSVAALVTLVICIPRSASGAALPEFDAVYADGESIRYDRIRTSEDRIAFLAQFGWEVVPEAVEEAKVTIPAEFDRVFTAYNEIQKAQGLDLSRCRKKEMMRYTYEVTNYPGYEGKVFANLLIYRNKVVGGDVSSADVSGFLHGFAYQKP